MVNHHQASNKMDSQFCMEQLLSTIIKLRIRWTLSSAWNNYWNLKIVCAPRDLSRCLLTFALFCQHAKEKGKPLESVQMQGTTHSLLWNNLHFISVHKNKFLHVSWATVFLYQRTILLFHIEYIELQVVLFLANDFQTNPPPLSSEIVIKRIKNQFSNFCYF